MRRSKKKVEAINYIIKALKKDFDPTCEVYCHGCGDCDAKILIGDLEWYKYLINNI